MTVAEIEDALLQEIRTLGAFATVASIGRSGADAAARLPAAYVYFDGDEELAMPGRPVDRAAFLVLVRVKHLRSEADAARDAYQLIDLVREAIRGKTLQLPGIGPFTCPGRRLTDYDESSGTIGYAVRFETDIYQPVPEG